MRSEEILISYRDVVAWKDELEAMIRGEMDTLRVNKFLQDNFRCVFDANFVLGTRPSEEYSELLASLDEPIKLELLRPLSRRQYSCVDMIMGGDDPDEVVWRFWDFLDDYGRSGKKMFLSVAEIGALSLIYEKTLVVTAP